MIFSRALLVSGLVLTGWVATGWTEEPNPGADQWLLARYDANGDQVISQEEVSGRRDRMFGHLDVNEDGMVSFVEYQSLDARKREYLLKARFDKLDQNGNGEVDAQEYRSYLGSFDRFDGDGDGRVTAADLSKGQPATVAAADTQNSDTRCVLWFCVRGSLD